MSDYIKHFKTISTHKYYVFKNCCKAGLFWRGVKHDLSKFSPTEFIESAQNYTGNSSPIDVAKAKYGWSKAWMHHKGRNRHHYEYYIDNCDNGGEALQMPFKDAVELICDYLGAGQAYMKKNFSYAAEYKWWENKKQKPLLIHSQTKNFIELTLRELKESPQKDKEILSKEHLFQNYKKAENWSDLTKSPDNFLNK